MEKMLKVRSPCDQKIIKEIPLVGKKEVERDSSGIGMGGIQYSMHEMTRVKLMVINSDVL